MNYKRTEITAAELARQEEIMERVAERNAALPAPPLALVDTYGCQQNEADSEKLRGMLKRMGYEMTTSEADADVIVINTCAVREHAEQRVLGNVGALVHTKKAKPSQIIALCGCGLSRAERISFVSIWRISVARCWGMRAMAMRARGRCRSRWGSAITCSRRCSCNSYTRSRAKRR